MQDLTLDNLMYRYVETHYVDSVLVSIQAYKIVAFTPCGMFINVWGKKKWLSNNWRKKYAYPTVEEAEEAFIKRKERQILILSSQLEDAKLARKIVLNDDSSIFMTGNRLDRVPRNGSSTIYD
jgi:hypothetical protein